MPLIIPIKNMIDFSNCSNIKDDADLCVDYKRDKGDGIFPTRCQRIRGKARNVVGISQ